MVILKTPEEIDKIAASGRAPAKTHRLLRFKARPGVTTGELTRPPSGSVPSQGGQPVFKGYKGFPGSICASPKSTWSTASRAPTRSSAADVLSVDVGVELDAGLRRRGHLPIGRSPG